QNVVEDILHRLRIEAEHPRRWREPRRHLPHGLDVDRADFAQVLSENDVRAEVGEHLCVERVERVTRCELPADLAIDLGWRGIEGLLACEGRDTLDALGKIALVRAPDEADARVIGPGEQAERLGGGWEKADDSHERWPTQKEVAAASETVAERRRS